MRTHIISFNTLSEQLEFNKHCVLPIATINKETNEVCLNPHTIYKISSGTFVPEDIWNHYSKWQTSLQISNPNNITDIHIYNDNNEDKDIIWYFTVPKEFNYNIYDDEKKYLQNVFFEIIDNNLFGKYKLYKSKTKNKTLNIIISKI